MEKEQFEGEGKYEVRYYFNGKQYRSEKTNSWFKYMALRLTKKVIYYKVFCN